jgi:hypothetical protein
MGAGERISNLVGSHRTVRATGSAIPDLLGTPQLEFVRVSGREALSELFTYTVDRRGRAGYDLQGPVLGQHRLGALVVALVGRLGRTFPARRAAQVVS